MGEFLSIVFLGAVVGSLYALTAFGLVVTYRTSGVFNFAQGAIGLVFAYVYFQLAQGGQVNFVFFVYEQNWRLPRFLALLLVVGVLAPGLGWLLEVGLFRRLRAASSVVQIVATIGLLISLQGLVSVIWGAATTLTPRSIFPTTAYAVGEFRTSFDKLATMALALALAGGLLAFLRFSPLGIRMRAVVDRPELAEVMGVDSKRIATLSWAIGTAFAALAGILVAPFYGSLDTFTLIFLGLAAIAAAVVGRLESLPVTLAAGLAIGVTRSLVQKYASGDLVRQLEASIPFLVLFAVLFLPRRWPTPAGPAYRPAAREAAVQTPQQKAVRLGILAAVLVVPVFFTGTSWQPHVLGGSWATFIALVPPTALIFLSLVILSGYAGQVSLCQAALAGFGAFIAAHLVVDWNWPFLLAAPAAALATVPLGALLASRATQLPPLFLGLATLAFASLMDEVAFNSKSFSNGLSGIFFERPEFLAGPRAYYFFGLVVFAVFAVLAVNLRRGRTGLALAAMRDSTLGIASVGEGVARLKLTIFVLSAFIAGLGGALLAGASEQASPSSFFKLQSMLFIALAVIGGIGSWTGALAGASLLTLLAPLFHQDWVQGNFVGKTIFHGQLEQLLPVFFGIGAIGLASNPNGMVEQVREGWQKFRERTRAVQAGGAGVPAGTAMSDERRAMSTALVAYPHALYFHRGGCPLTIGKDGGGKVTKAKAKKLEPCPVCEPELATAS